MYSMLRATENAWEINLGGEQVRAELTSENLEISKDELRIKIENILSVSPCNCQTSSSLRYLTNNKVLKFVRKKQKCNHCSTFPKTTDTPVIDTLSARLYYASDVCKGSSLQFKTIRLTFVTAHQRDQFVESIEQHLNRYERPRKLLIHINPYCGRKLAKDIFYKNVEPIFKVCGIECDIVTMKHTGHCKEDIDSRDLSQFDGIVCVGGDGTANELINALMQKTIRPLDADPETTKIVKPLMPIGIIPAGSTDALVCSTNGSQCPVNSALLIAMGNRIQIDVGSIHSEGKATRYFAGFLSYGFFGDNIKSAENYRWMGPLRYMWTGWQTFLRNQSYTGKVIVDVLVETEKSSLHDSMICLQGCYRCANSSKSEPRETKRLTLDTKFQSLSCALIANRCVKSKGGIAPFAHLGDSCMDVLVVEKCSRFNFLQFLRAVGNSDTQYPFNFDFTKSYKVLSLKFSPETSESERSVWNCDGEVLPAPPEITVNCHNQVLSLYASGVRSDSFDLSSNSSSFSTEFSLWKEKSKLCFERIFLKKFFLA